MNKNEEFKIEVLEQRLELMDCIGWVTAPPGECHEF